MAKTNNGKTNGHTVPALKPAAPKKATLPSKTAVKEAPAKTAVKAAPAKSAVKAAPAKSAVKPATQAAAPKPAAKAAPAVKTAVRKPAKPAATPATTPAASPTAKTVTKPAARAAKLSPEAPAAASTTAEAKDKLRKGKLVRDSFTMPEQEYAVLGQVKKACIKAGFEIKKSELLRIGVALISQLDMATLQRVLDSLPTLKTGRPRND